MPTAAIVDSGVANLASVCAALQNLGVEATVTADDAMIRDAAFVVLPGVGAFGSVEGLRSRGLDTSITARVAEGKPLLAICLGMQMLCEASEENPGVRGLGVIPGTCRALPTTARVPHLGWNGVEPDPGCVYVQPGAAAFANSYGLTTAPRGWRAAWTDHGIRFASALERDRTLACQFHPELSGAYGTALLRRWLENTRAGVSATTPRSVHSLAARLIPCLDVCDGRVVKGVQFQQLRDTGDPATRAGIYEEQGADEIVMLDITASVESRDTQVETVRQVRRALRIPLTVGGGVRQVDDARSLLAAGADKVSVNTAAVRNPDLITQVADEFGTQCAVLAIDVRRQAGSWEVLIVGGRDSTGMDAKDWAAEGAARGAGEILLTSWDRDGTRSGCDLDLLAAVRAAVTIPIIASGGIGTREHVQEALAAGADAVLAASIFHDDDDTVAEIKTYLADRGINVRR